MAINIVSGYNYPVTGDMFTRAHIQGFEAQKMKQCENGVEKSQDNTQAQGRTPTRAPLFFYINAILRRVSKGKLSFRLLGDAQASARAHVARPQNCCIRSSRWESVKNTRDPRARERRKDESRRT